MSNDVPRLSKTMEEECEEAVKRLARRVGITPEEFKRRLDEVRDNTPPITRECLTLWEFQSYPSLSENRLAHVAQCDFCKFALKINELKDLCEGKE